jgi:perosamine synthetase
MKLINQIEPLITEYDKRSLNRYMKSGGWLTEYKENYNFEKKFKHLTKSKYCVTMPNGTLTITGILLALELKKRDIVLVSAYTMVATANAAKILGLKVKFVDIDPINLNMCPTDLQKKINKNVKAIVYTTMNGRSGHIKKISEICKKKKIFLIEDSAHSLGSYFEKKHHGNFGIASSFSLSMPKIITTGQGGVVCTNNLSIYKKIKLIKDFGRKKPGTDEYKILGFNFKFTDLQASLGLSQLQNIHKKIKKKKKFLQCITMLSKKLKK